MWVNMAFGQTAVSAFYSWGVAPGYGDKWPSAKSLLVAPLIPYTLQRQKDFAQ